MPAWLERLTNESILNEGLKRLDDMRREVALPLDLSQVLVSNASRVESFRQHVRGSNGILDRVVDSYATHGRHGVGGITDEQ